MSSQITIKQQSKIYGVPEHLPSSKSISNRALILNALSGNRGTLLNLSQARDTELMKALVESPEKLIDVMDAGTTMRFLTAFFAITGENKILTGTARMKQRPIELLVNALREIGATIEYLEAQGFPPIKTKQFTAQKATIVRVPGNVSSQYVSALMMIAPKLPNGLTIELVGQIGSVPYIKMTKSLMNDFGIDCQFEDQKIIIPSQSYQPAKITIEADWSAASYWFAFVALAKEATITLKNISLHSLQGDVIIIEIMEKLGVKSSFSNGELLLSKQDCKTEIEWDFKDCPDLAQTVLPVCAAKGIKGVFKGLESLRIKETDRITALQMELKKIGASIAENNGEWVLIPDSCDVTSLQFITYHDHRMAMGLAPLATKYEVQFDDSTVVNKSYPGFWLDCQSVGFQVLT